MSEKTYLTWLKNGVEVPEGTEGAVSCQTAAIAPETGLYRGSMTQGSCDYRTALFLDGGAVSEGQSVIGALQGGSWNGTSVEGVRIDSRNALFNGIMVNDTDVTMTDVTMTAKGSGGNDFKGYGAGLAFYGKSNAVVDRYVFDGEGVLRHGVFVGGTKAEDALTVTVKNSFIRADGSKLESKAEGMSGCPWMLGISANGHARATMCDGYSTVNYENNIMLSDGWGVLSVDDTGDTVDWGTYSIRLNVKDCVVDATTAGTQTPSCYTTYSIGGCFNRFFGCVIGDAADSERFRALKAALPATGVDYDYKTVKYAMTYASVVANEHASAGWYDGCDVTTKYGVMYHKTGNVRYAPGKENAAFPACGVTQVENSTFNTYGAAFLVKACVPAIEVKNSKFNSEKGVIVQLMTCDDPGMGAPAFSECVVPGAVVEKDPAYNPFDYTLRDQTFFRKFNVKGFVGDVQASFVDCNKANGTALEGSFFNAINVQTEGEGLKWWGQNLILRFDNCDIVGACSSADALHEEYSFYTAKADNQYGKVAVDADGREIKGTWKEEKTNPMMAMMMEMNDMMQGGPGGMPGGPGGMPGGPEGGMGGPGGPGGMPGGAPAAPTYSFVPERDAEGKLIPVGDAVYTPDTGWIVSDDATLLGNMNNVPAPTVNNGVWVLLCNGSVWTPVGTSYVSRLEVAEGCRIEGKVCVDGAEIAVEPGKVYTGSITVCA